MVARLLLASSIVILPSLCWAKSSLEGRVEHLEQFLNNEFNVETLQDNASIKQEINELRGTLEEQQHAIEKLQEKQKELTNLLSKQVMSGSSVDTQSSRKANDHRAGDARSSYESAYSLVEKKSFREAQIALQDFIWQYPDSDLIPNAHYWLGEVILALWNQNKADQHLLVKSLDSFKLVVDKYSKHHKAVDSLLKLGLVEADNSNWDVAYQYLSRVVKEYPDSSRAQIANAKISSLIKSGHIKHN